MLDWLYSVIRGVFQRHPVRLAIVRRYQDANGAYVGELYMWREHRGIGAYMMIGASLDTLPLESTHLLDGEQYYALDTVNDFLAPMPLCRIRVGALDPADNDRIRMMVARLPKRNMTCTIQNRFIERVMEQKI